MRILDEDIPFSKKEPLNGITERNEPPPAVTLCTPAGAGALNKRFVGIENLLFPSQHFLHTDEIF